MYKSNPVEPAFLRHAPVQHADFFNPFVKRVEAAVLQVQSEAAGRELAFLF